MCSQIVRFQLFPASKTVHTPNSIDKGRGLRAGDPAKQTLPPGSANSFGFQVLGFIDTQIRILVTQSKETSTNEHMDCCRGLLSLEISYAIDLRDYRDFMILLFVIIKLRI